jgi:hypothetical protein
VKGLEGLVLAPSASSARLEEEGGAVKEGKKSSGRKASKKRA